MPLLVIENLSVEVRKKKMSETLMFPEPEPYVDDVVVNGEHRPTRLESRRVYFSKATGEDLGTSKEVSYRTEWVDPDGNVYSLMDPAVKWFIREPSEDGLFKLTPALPYQGSKTIQGMFEINLDSVSDYIPVGVYEIFVNPSKYNEPELRRMESKLYEKALEWRDKHKAMVGKYVHRKGGKPYAMILKPHFKIEEAEIKFGFTMTTSRTKVHFDHLANAPEGPQTVTLIEEPDTAELLKAFATA